MSKKKAARLGQSDLSNAIAMAAEGAKTRIEQIDEASVDSVTGAADPVSTVADTVADILGIGDITDVTMGMFPSDPIDIAD